MKCPRCQQENPAGQKFCGDCGARLASSCPSCGAANPPGQKFCGECGAALGPSEPRKAATPDTYTPRHLAEKILTSRESLAWADRIIESLTGGPSSSVDGRPAFTQGLPRKLLPTRAKETQRR